MQYLLPLFALLAAPQTVYQWEFNSPNDTAWQPNAHLADVAIRDGVLHARAVEWDPFWICDGIEIPATPWQAVIIRMRASAPGEGDLFWTGDTSGPNGGLSEDRKARFSVRGGDAWQEIALYPFWHGAGTIRKLRLDVYNNASFEIDAITIVDWSGDAAPFDASTWDAAALDAWRASPDGAYRWSPPLALDTTERGWASLTIDADAAGTGALVWGSGKRPGMQRQSFNFQPGRQTCNLELQGIGAWAEVNAVGLFVPPDGVRVHALSLSDAPAGPADLRTVYFGPEDGVNRAGQPARVIAQFTNRGGEAIGRLIGRVEGPVGLAVTATIDEARNVGFEDRAVLSWIVEAAAPGEYPVTLVLEGAGAPVREQSTIRITPRPGIPAADYVPAPRPVATGVEVAAYYFPGWDSPAKWDPIQRVAPVRKPVLGWYDEANPEIVDWQIKWAVENGISVFLVDWYWVQGSQHLQHWIEAYRKSRYRDQLKIALMWANHNPPGTHSAEDWKAVSEHWIAEYFPMDSYHRIDGEPALFLWDHRALREDLGGSEAVARVLADSREAARAAGLPGINYVALHPFGQEAMLAGEGYNGVTRYHEWGHAEGLAENPMYLQFADVAATVEDSWRAQHASRAGLTFYPVVDSGWDSRPWHGNQARVIAGRTPELFTRMLRDAKAFAEETEAPLVILGPMNEWGEGSYLEPNTEFGFDMMNAVRAVFGADDPASWPPNVAPVDVALGPYDFPEPARRDRWTFDTGLEGWRAMMGLGNVTVADGALIATTDSADPAFVAPLYGVEAEAVAGVRFRMQISGDLPERLAAQLFWSRGGEATSEAASAHIPIKTDGAMHEYELPLADHPRWRGDITLFRFDPCSARGVTVRLEEFSLIPAPTAGNRDLAGRILADERLDQVLEKAHALLATGLTAGDGYGEVWIRDLNTFIEVAADVVPHAELRAALVRFFHFQGEDGNIVDGYIPKAQAGTGYEYIASATEPDYLAHKNTVETDQESSLIQAVARYVHVTGDRTLLDEVVNGQSVTQRLLRAVDFLHTHRFAPEYGLLWGGTTADWGDVQPEHEWGVVLDENSHRAIDIYDNALCVAALNDFLAIAPLSPDDMRRYTDFRDGLKARALEHLWDPARRQFRPHLYLAGSPFPEDFNEAAIYYHGGTAVAIQAGLLTRAQVAEALGRMRANVRAIGAASIGLTMYPAYPEGFFKNPILTKPYTYQNGGDWTWFGGRMLSGLVANGYMAEAYEEMEPMVERVLKNGGFYEWYTIENQPAGSGSYRGSAGVLGKAILELREWAAEHAAQAAD
ncbi:MAG: glycoside hydrolase family 99-like domain-containing protein [Candidatus Hydrogenedentes bacterium]|nr:glycoside hydrolase family 99-like domain-containing protein [Candidatus Hydrogenedentota bacterium]